MKSHRLHVVALAALLAGLLSCSKEGVQDDDIQGDDDSTPADDDDSNPGDDDSCGDNPIQDDGAEIGDVGACEFKAEPAGHIGVSGQLHWTGGMPEWWFLAQAYFQEHPATVFHEVVVEDGECRYLRTDFGVCDPPCSSDELCSPDDACVTYPERLYGGALTIVGAGYPENLEWHEELGYYFEDLSPFDSDDVITATWIGGEISAQTLQTRGVDPIDEEFAHCGVHLEATRQAVFSWTPGPDPDACVELVLNGASDGHGLPPEDIIECHSPDDGQIVISSIVMGEFPLWDQFEPIHPGQDWPSSKLTRYQRASVEVEQGEVELVVRSTITFYVNE